MISYGRVLQISPRSVEAHSKLAQTHMKMGSWAAAYQELSKTVELDPQNWPAQLELARLQLAGGRAKDGHDRAVLILKGDPKNADAQMLLSQADVSLGDLKDAQDEANTAIAMAAPGRADLYLNLGHIQARQKDLSGAEQSFKRAISLDPQGALPRTTLGRLYQENKRWSEAEKVFEDAIQAAPKDVAPRGSLAALYFSQGQEAQGEKVLVEAKEQLSSNPNAYKLLGESYLARRQYDKALAEFASLSAKYPSDLSVRKTYIQLLILNNRIDEADTQAKTVLQLTPTDPEMLVLKGQIEIRRNQTDQAISTLQQAVKAAPDNALGHYHLGVAYKQSGNSQQAEEEWRQAVHLRPELPEAWIALGSSAAARSDWRGLQEISDQLSKYSPVSFDAILFHATARYNQGDPAGAEADLNRLKQLAPDHPAPYIKLGQLRLSQKRFAEADAYFRQALMRDPNSIEAVKGVVEVDLSKRQPADALKFLEDQISRNPKSAALYLVQGQLQLDSKQLDPAETSFSKAVDLEHSNVAALVLLAQTHDLQGKPKLALADYQKAITVSPHDPRLYIGLGSVYEKLGDWHTAKATYQKALAIRTDDPYAANSLAYLLLEHNGDSTVALSLAQTAQKGLPKFPNAADTLGWAYYHNRAYSAAVPLFENALKAAPNNQTYLYHLGMTYQAMDDSTRAKTELEKAISIDPSSDIANRARQAISQHPAS